MSLAFSTIEKYGKDVEIVIDETVNSTKGLIQPYYHSNNPYKPLTEYQKDYFLLIVEPHVTFSHYLKTTVICEGEKYEVKSINSYTKNEKVLYQQAVIRRLHE